MGTAKQRGMVMILTKPYEIDWFRLLHMRRGLRLEIAGMKSRGRSCYAMAKEELGVKGNRQKVLDQVNEMIQSVKRERGIA